MAYCIYSSAKFQFCTFIGSYDDAGWKRLNGVTSHGLVLKGQPVRRSITLCPSKMISAVLDV